MSTDALWYAARGAGTVCLLLLTLTLVLGIVARSGRGLAGLPGFAVGRVHRVASLIAVTLLAIHVITLLLDPYARLSLPDVIVPFGAGYRPLWVGLGTVAADLLIALVVTSLIRRRLGVRAWRAVHWVAYAAWPLALAHGLGSGTDAATPWLRAVAATCAAAVTAAVVWRCSTAFLRRPRPAYQHQRFGDLGLGDAGKSMIAPPLAPQPVPRRRTASAQAARPGQPRTAATTRWEHP